MLLSLPTNFLVSKQIMTDVCNLVAKVCVVSNLNLVRYKLHGLFRIFLQYKMNKVNLLTKIL